MPLLVGAAVPLHPREGPQTHRRAFRWNRRRRARLRQDVKLTCANLPTCDCHEPCLKTEYIDHALDELSKYCYATAPKGEATCVADGPLMKCALPTSYTDFCTKFAPKTHRLVPYSGGVVVVLVGFGFGVVGGGVGVRGYGEGGEEDLKTKLHASSRGSLGCRLGGASYQLPAVHSLLAGAGSPVPQPVRGRMPQGDREEVRLATRTEGVVPSSLTSPTHHPASHLQVRLAVDARLGCNPLVAPPFPPPAPTPTPAPAPYAAAAPPAPPDPAPPAPAPHQTPPPHFLITTARNGQSALHGDPARHSRQPTRDGARESAAAAAVPPATAVPHATAGHAHNGHRAPTASVSVARTGHHDAPPAAVLLFIPRRRLPSVAAQGAHHSLPSRTNGIVHGVSSRQRQAAGGHRRRGSASHLLPGCSGRDQDGMHGAEFRRR